MNYYIAFDGEFGGIGVDKSLLTLYVCLVTLEIDSTFRIIKDLELKIKPNNSVYQVTAEALSINKINLVEHDKVAITEKEAGTKLYDFLSTSYNETGKNKLIPIGHNPNADILQITNKLISANSWNQYVSYRIIDTAGLAQFLKITGKIPDNISCSLSHLISYFAKSDPNTIDMTLHDAKVDTHSTLYVLSNLINLTK